MQQIANKWDTRLYNEKHSFVYEYGSSLIDLLGPKPDERILDLGCGSGELTHKISQTATEVVGIDRSAEMIERAKKQFPSCQFRKADATDFKFDKPFDAVFSNAVLHWVTSYQKAIDCIYNNLKDGGRMVVEFGGKGNVETITGQLRRSLLKWGYAKQAQLSLWHFPSIAEYTGELEAKGFKVCLAQWYARPTELTDENNGIKDWLSMFGTAFFKGVAKTDILEILDETQTNLRADLFINGKWFADYKRIRIVAHK